MFSIADLIERAKARANIDTDYRLAKVIRINQSALGNYKAGRSMPDERVLEQLCALSGDDVAVFAAQIQAERARTPEGKNLWSLIAARLAGGASPAILSVLFSLGLIAATAQDAKAGTAPAVKLSAVQIIYIVSSSVFVSARRALVRLRRCGQLFPVCLACLTVF